MNSHFFPKLIWSLQFQVCITSILLLFLHQRSLHALPPFQTYKTEAETKQILKQFIYRRDGVDDYYPIDPFPTQLEPKTVESFLRDQLNNKDLSLAASGEIIRLAYFYHSIGIVPDLIALTKQIPKVTDIKELQFQACWITGIGLLGDNKKELYHPPFVSHSVRPALNATQGDIRLVYGSTEWALGRKLLDDWMEAFPLDSRFVEALAIYNAFLPTPSSSRWESNGIYNFKVTQKIIEEANLASLRDALIKRQSLLSSKKYHQGEQVRIGTEVLADSQANLWRLVETAVIKHDILTASRPARLDQLVSIYLGLDGRHYPFLEGDWAPIQLLREAQSGNLREVIAALKRTPKQAKSSKQQEGVLIVSLAALEYFGDPLSTEEQNLLNKSRSTLFGVLLRKQD